MVKGGFTDAQLDALTRESLRKHPGLAGGMGFDERRADLIRVLNTSWRVRWAFLILIWLDKKSCAKEFQP
jgi:hypothetical protein